MMTDLSVSDHGFRDWGRNGLTGAKLVNGHIMGFLELKTNYVAMTGIFFQTIILLLIQEGVYATRAEAVEDSYFQLGARTLLVL